MGRVLLLALLLVACSKGPDADLPSIAEARSLAAEWALVNELANEHKVTAIYARSMRESLRDQLRANAGTLTQPNSAYGREIGALIAERDNAPASELRAHSIRLKQIEDSLESA